MQDHHSSSDRLRPNLILGMVVATWAAIINWYVGFILIIPMAVALTLIAAIPAKVSLFLAAVGLALIFTVAMACLLLIVGRRNPHYGLGCVAMSWGVGCFVGEAFALLLLILGGVVSLF